MKKPTNNNEWEIVDKLDPWVRRRYLLIKEHFGNREFSRKELEEFFENLRLKLRKKGVVDDPTLTTINMGELLSILRKAGLITVRKDSADFRKNYYKLKYPHDTKPTKDKLKTLLKAAADQIRGGLDYKSLLVFLFYKAISDRWIKKVHEYELEGKTKTEAFILANKNYYRLFDEEAGKLYTWHEVVKSRDTIKEMGNALIRISEMNKDDDSDIGDLKKLVEVLGLIGFIKEDNLHTLEEIVKIFNKVDFSEFSQDVLGDAYEWILGYFAPQKAKEGEVYTPKEVIRLIVELLDIEDECDVLDPASGSGGMLIEAYNYAKEKYREPSLMLYGQERNEITATLSKMNLILHGIIDYKIYDGYDSLTNPQFEKAEYVLANPPWNQDGYDELRLSDRKVKHIYKYGFTNKQSADWAWIQLMLHYAKKKVGIVLDAGSLFRGGAEKGIRKGVVDDDLIECIVLLPEKLFYNTGAPGIIIVFNKHKPEERKDKILFINASNEYEPHPQVRRLNRLGEEHIAKIVKAYRDFKDVKGFARVVSRKEIKEKDYNLNVTLYVFPEIEMEEIGLKEEVESFREIESREEELVKKAMSYVEGILSVAR